MSQRLGRRPPRLDRIFQNISSPVYFVTFCTHRRRKVLATASVHDAFVTFGRRAADQFNIAVGRYVIMPDHIHLFVAADHDFRLGHWVGTLKQTLAKVAGGEGKSGRFWQEGFFDHVLRSDESLAQKWEYIVQNPARAGLIDKTADWPNQGEIVVIDRA